MVRSDSLLLKTTMISILSFSSKLKISFLGVLLLLTFVVNGQFQGEVLKFKLAALNLPNCDFEFDGASDPYAVLFYSTKPTFRPGHEYRHWNKFAETRPKKDTLNPVWDETLVFQYINGTDQAWRIFVFDKDSSWYNPFDDPLGHVEVRVEDYLSHINRSMENGSLIVKPIQMFLTQPLGGLLLVTPELE